MKFSHGKYFKFFFSGAELEKIEFKIAQVTYSIPELGLEKQKMEEIITRFVKDIQIFKDSPSKEIDRGFSVTFHVQLTSSTSNFDYQLIDATWMEQLWSAARTNQLTDVEFLVGDKSFSAHRFILSARSPVFTAMFNSDMTEAKTGTVAINETNPDVFEVFLKFLYTGTLEPFSLAEDKQLLALADKYQVETLLIICQSFPPEVNKEELVEFILCS